MSDERVIAQADLRAIENNLNTIHRNIDVVNGNVNTVDSNVRVVYDEISNLAQEFHDYIELAGKQHNLSLAETRLVKIRQELENKYGHYAEVRRTTVGILQADDLGLIRKETINTATEELMIATPDYWLAPCLVALSAWISDRQELAEKALREGIRRDDEKTSLLFALICRRAGRKQACLKWTQRYLANQDEENLDRKCVIILDAFASGLLGADSEGVISRQMADWLEKLSEKPGFIEQQTKQWSEAINLKRGSIPEYDYSYLKKYSKTWPVLEDIMEGAYLHAQIFEYFDHIFQQKVQAEHVKEQLDEILTSLVTDFDKEELPLREDEKMNQFIVDFQGDIDRAKANMEIEKSAFESNKDFTQLLTDAAMKPGSANSSISTQKFAIALSKDWIMNAYKDIAAENKMKIPNEIEINIDTFNDWTTDGQNERELEEKFNILIDSELSSGLSICKMTAFEQYCLIGGAIVAGLGLVMLMFDSMFMGLVTAIGGVGLVIYHYSCKKNVAARTAGIIEKYEEKRNAGRQILLATLAEVVDFRAEFSKKDGESQKVLDFLDSITPEQYVRKLADSTRRIKVAE